MTSVLGMMPTKGIPLPMISCGRQFAAVHAGVAGNSDERIGARRMSKFRGTATGDLSYGRRRHGRTRDPAPGGGAGTAQPRARSFLHRHRTRPGSAAGARRGLSAGTHPDRRPEARRRPADAGHVAGNCPSSTLRNRMRLLRTRRRGGGLQHGRLRGRTAGDGGAARARSGGGHGAERRPRLHQPPHRPLCGARAGQLPGNRGVLSARAGRRSPDCPCARSSSRFRRSRARRR